MNREQLRTDPGLGEFVSDLFSTPAYDYPPGIAQAVSHGFRPIGLLGESDEWTSWVGSESGSNYEVVIKAACIDTPHDADTIERYLTEEYRLLKELKTTRSVHGKSLHAQGECSYLAMDFVGEQHIAEYALGPFAKDGVAVAALMYSAVESVAELHRDEVVHGDLKPQHFVMRGETPILIDFGLAASLDDPARALFFPARLGGSERYIAPEILAGKATGHDYRHDVYSTGMVLQTVAELWSGKHGEDVPEAFQMVIDRAIKGDPAERYSTAELMKQALREAMGLSGKPRRRIINGPSAVAASVAVAAAIIGGTLFARGPSATAITDPPPKTIFELDWTRGAVLEGSGRDAFLREIEKLSEADQASWEARFVRDGSTDYPFGAKPFGDLIALKAEYNAMSGALAWSDPAQNLYLMREDVGTRILLSDTGSFTCPSINDAGDKLLAIAADRTVYEFELNGVDTPIRQPTPLTNAVLAYYLGDQVVSIGHIDNRVGIWDRVEVKAWTDHTVAHAIRNNGRLQVARWAPNGTDGGSIWIEDCIAETLAGPLEVPSPNRPVAIDYDHDEGLLCMALMGGEVLLYRSSPAEWVNIDASFDVYISSVELAPEIGRLFLGGQAVHVVDLETGKDTMMLGGGFSGAATVWQLVWNPKAEAITAVSDRSVLRWSTAGVE